MLTDKFEGNSTRKLHTGGWMAGIHTVDEILDIYNARTMSAPARPNVIPYNAGVGHADIPQMYTKSEHFSHMHLAAPALHFGYDTAYMYHTSGLGNYNVLHNYSQRQGRSR